MLFAPDIKTSLISTEKSMDVQNPARHWEISPNDLNKIILPVIKIIVSSCVDIKSLPVCPELATLSNSEQNLKQS